MALPYDSLENFLSTSALNVHVSRIDFEAAGISEYKGHYAILLDDVLSRAECSTLLQMAELSTEQGWERAMVTNHSSGRQTMDTKSRECARIIFDMGNVAMKIWKRIEHCPEVEEILRLESASLVLDDDATASRRAWHFSRVNERVRFLKYVGGEYFRPHCDWSYKVPQREERALLTLQLYLNGDAPHQDGSGMEHADRSGHSDGQKSVLVGGATTFHSPDMKNKIEIRPKAGRILIFQHRDLLHSGDDVMQGVKYTMRTDLLYKAHSSVTQ